jgi:Domain of unknown function (DUF4386)
MNSNKVKAIIVGILILFAYAVLASDVIDSKVVAMISEVLSGAAVIAIAVIMLPFFKPFGKKASFWYIALRIVEGLLMVIAGFLFLSDKTLLLDIRDGIYIGHAYIFAVAALFFYYLLYTSKLIPRWLSAWGFIASILLIIVNILEAAEIVQPSMILYLPIISNEVFLAVWLMIKGFKPVKLVSEITVVSVK